MRTLAASQKYKDSPAGKIPVDWQYALLDSLARRASGHTPDREVAAYWNGGVRWVSLADCDRLDRLYISDTTYNISEEGINNSSANLLPAGVVILSRDAGVGKSAITTMPMAVSQHFIAWICSDHLHNTYLYYWLQWNKPLFERMAVGSTIKTIGFRFFEKLGLALPVDVREQCQIAEVLQNTDDCIFGIEKLLAAKLDQRRGLMQQLLNGTSRFSEFQGTKWIKVKIGDILRPEDRYAAFDDEKQYRLASIRRRSGGIFARESLYGRQIKTKVLKMIRTGDFIISRMQVVHGALGTVPAEFDGYFVSDSYDVLVPRSPERIDAGFLNYLSQRPEIYRLALISSHGVHIEKMTFGLEDFLREMVLIPPTIEEQRRIAETFKSYDDEIALLEKQTAALRIQKLGLMKKLLTGQMRLNR